jgi:hypothetical protein
MAEYTEEDVGNIVALEHINLQVPDQALATLFYVVGLGFTRDPYLNVGLQNMWVNAGEQQFHLPTRQAQVLHGHIGLVVRDLDALQTRLSSVAGGLKDTQFCWSAESNCLSVTCPWGNRYRCFRSEPRFSDMAVGIPYIEFLVPPNAAAAIVSFYKKILGAPGEIENGVAGVVGQVAIGRSQRLYFRESNQPLLTYDGHHIAIYVARFSDPYSSLKSRGLISEEVRNHQFRFDKIIDPDSGQVVFKLEHEVRSLRHPMYHRPFINRDPSQSQRSYKRGWDALVPFVR